MWTTDRMLTSLAQPLRSDSVITLERDCGQNRCWEQHKSIYTMTCIHGRSQTHDSWPTTHDPRLTTQDSRPTTYSPTTHPPTPIRQSLILPAWPSKDGGGWIQKLGVQALILAKNKIWTKRYGWTDLIKTSIRGWYVGCRDRERRYPGTEQISGIGGEKEQSG